MWNVKKYLVSFQFERAVTKNSSINHELQRQEIQKIFPDSFYENDFGTVGIVNENVSDETLKVIEVTTYRLETTYSDSRHPDSVSFSRNLEDDLKRRDFTVNAVAYDVSHEKVIDLFGGQEDIKNKIIRAVGNPDERFREDKGDLKSVYLKLLHLIERLHRQFLDVLKVELERAGIHDINNVQSLVLHNIGDDERRDTLERSPGRHLRHHLGHHEDVDSDRRRDQPDFDEHDHDDTEPDRIVSEADHDRVDYRRQDEQDRHRVEKHPEQDQDDDDRDHRGGRAGLLGRLGSIFERQDFGDELWEEWEVDYRPQIRQK